MTIYAINLHSHTTTKPQLLKHERPAERALRADLT